MSKLSIKNFEKYDELVYLADKDPELKEALKWADMQALQKGISLNEMIKYILDLRLKRKSTSSNC